MANDRHQKNCDGISAAVFSVFKIKVFLFFALIDLTPKSFFDKIGLKELISSCSAPVLGISAGSMNMADTVYCPPELDGEGVDKDFVRYFDGLGLCDINIFPHYNDMKDFVLDGLRMMEDIVYPDTYRAPVLALPDGSYVLVENGKAEICGESYLIVNGEIKK